ncbi:hypothetical protein AC579_9638 [Pseudocercospora musae]|uniref:Uncharacterized protein n=1 Tax=Pseudocercospora musae TaxID=113226 RepID=A0A139ITB4_9PEZI|nr:hypothetical protein AC579_9638 [Pseudocercospora musae]
MGYDAGFDIIPPISFRDSEEDKAKWGKFLTKIQEEFAGDAQVVSKIGYYEFVVGESPRLPRDGGKFMTFSSKISDGLTSVAEPYIRKVARIAREVFGDRVKVWNELNDAFSEYEFSDIRDSQRKYGSDEDAPWSDNNLWNTMHEFAGPTLTRTECADQSSRQEEEVEVDQEEGVTGWNSDEQDDEDHNNRPMDLTACDKECGYCGRCMY